MKLSKIYYSILLSIFINYSNSYLRSSFFSTTRSRSIEGKECISKNLKGQCMFSFECMNHKGNSIGICIEKYYVGSCCYFNSSADEDELIISNNDKITSESNLSITNKFNQQNILINYNKTSSNDIIKKNISNLIQQQNNDSNSQSLLANTQTTNLSNRNDLMQNDLLQNQQNLTKKITSNLIYNLNDDNSTTATNITTLNKLYNSEQIKPINLIDQTTINSLDVNYLLTNLNNFLANLTDNNRINNENKNRINLNKKQSNSLNNSLEEINDSIIKKNLTDSQLISTEQSIELPIKKYFADLECGLQSKKIRQTRVVGGRSAQKGEFPFQVLIKESTLFGYYIKSKCGGVLIHPLFVLTAAHCSPKFLGSLFVILGESNEPKPVVRAVKRMIIHKDYNINTFENDIALLELERPIELTGITPICLPIKESDDSFEMATVTGFGKLKFGGSIPTTLQVAKLPILDNKKCQEMYLEMGIVKKILPTFLCAGSINGGQDSCEGDSGSPLFAERKNGQFVLVGTVSHGVKCNYLPGIHMRTKLYLDWIYNTIQYSIDNSPKKVIQRLRYQ